MPMRALLKMVVLVGNSCDDVCSTKSSTSIWEVGSQSHKAVYGKTRGSNPERTEKDFGFFGERKGD